MLRFVLGLVIGLATGVSHTVYAGSDGWMWGWEVKVGKQVICRDPYVWHGVREIECERR
jgi:hypothetical protein